MQVTLNPVDWSIVARFPSAREFFEWSHSTEDSVTPEGRSCYDLRWSDSAMTYFEVAEALQNAASHVPGPVAAHLWEGILRLLCENGHVDEIGASQFTEGCTWISATPKTTKEIHRHVKETDWPVVYAALEKMATQAKTAKNAKADNAREEESDSGADAKEFVEQHIRVLEVATSGGFGLLGHIG